MNFAKFLRATFLQNASRQLLLNVEFDIRINKSASTAFRKVDNTKKYSEILLNRVSVNENSYRK